MIGSQITVIPLRDDVPYADDAMNLPVADADAAIPFYMKRLSVFKVVSRGYSSFKSVVPERDTFKLDWLRTAAILSRKVASFEVDDIESAFAEIKESLPPLVTSKSTGAVIRHSESSLSWRRMDCVTCWASRSGVITTGKDRVPRKQKGPASAQGLFAVKTYVVSSGA